MDSDTPKEASNGASLADRMTKMGSTPAAAPASTFKPKSGKLWSDETDSPLSPLADKLSEQSLSSDNVKTETPVTEPTDALAPPSKNEELAGAVTKGHDGATTPLNGSDLQETDYTVEIKLADLQADPKNPLYSVTTFEELHLKQELIQGIYAMSFHKPSKVQEKTLPLLIKNPPTNLIGQSQSGTGKTAAFTLNILQRLDLSTPELCSTPQAIVLAPTRELARQIAGVIKVMGTYLKNLSVDLAIPAEKDARGRTVQSAVVVGTPGTVLNVVQRRLLDPRRVGILVLDEADNMLDQGGLADHCFRVRKLLPRSLQCVLFSATFPPEVAEFASKFAPDANQMKLQQEELTVEGIKQIYLDCNSDSIKFDTLIKFYGLLTIGSSIIFVRTRDTASSLEASMVREGHKVVYLTGELEGSKRDAVIDAFRNGSAKVLITTNVLARGIDVQSVSMVINYDVPTTLDPTTKTWVPDCQTYLHRIGRTGRFGRVGVAVTFVGNRTDWESLMKIQDYFDITMTRVRTEDWDELETTVTKIIKSSRSGSNFESGAKMLM